ncbi:MAG: accessory gene regulator B family protein [Firmicutes bacterium]|nr:accessory gene regulator B family protein [Bacillota bacterium]
MKATKNTRNMFDLFCHNISDAFIKKGRIDSEDREIFAYGISRLIVNAIMIVVFTIIGLFFRHLLEIYVFLLFFIPLRKFAGGFHCESFVTCSVASCLCVISPIVINTYIDYIPAFFAMWIISGAIIIGLSPIQDHRKKLSAEESLVYRKRTILIFFFSCITCIIAYILRQYVIFKVIIEVFGIVGLLLVCGYIKNAVKK